MMPRARVQSDVSVCHVDKGGGSCPFVSTILLHETGDNDGPCLMPLANHGKWKNRITRATTGPWAAHNDKRHMLSECWKIVPCFFLLLCVQIAPFRYLHSVQIYQLIYDIRARSGDGQTARGKNCHKQTNRTILGSIGKDKRGQIFTLPPKHAILIVTSGAA